MPTSPRFAPFLVFVSSLLTLLTVASLRAERLLADVQRAGVVVIVLGVYQIMAGNLSITCWQTWQ